MQSAENLDPCLGADDAARLRALAGGFGPYRTYVSAAQESGVGRGLVRRHDALMNHVLSRARDGVQEDMDALTARMNLFRGTWFESGEVFADGCEMLLEHPAFIEGARRISGRPIVRPCMLFANILVPGQELPIHTDTPAFVGLDQTNAPEWLLVCMGHSRLFDEWRVPMIAAVYFFGGCEGGDFVYFGDGPEGAVQRAPAGENTAIVIDSETVFHGVARVGGPDHPAPPSQAGMEIAHVGDGRWVVSAASGVVAEYASSDIRLSAQWKARCHAPGDEEREPLSRTFAEARLIDDLRKRGVIDDSDPDDTQVALAMIQTYVRFPQASLR